MFIKYISKFIANLGIVFSLFTVLSSHGFASDSLDKMAENAKTSVKFRYRIESVDQDSIDEDALASTLLSRVSWTSGSFENTKIVLEADNVSVIGDDDFNSTVNGNADYPVVADPEGTDLNQAYVNYHGISNSSIKLGRHRINHDDQRFIGGVAWRQNEQTYDGASIDTKLNDSLRLQASFIVNVNRILGPNGPNADLKGDLAFLNGAYQFNENNKIIVSYYHLDFDAAASLSTGTFGFNYSYNRPLSPSDKLAANLIFMRQSNEGDNPTEFDADFYRFSLKYSLDAYWAQAGIEVLGADNGVGFQTPLATLHIFQGFADKFLSTPGAGLEDMFLTIGGTTNGIKWSFSYHDFSAEEGSAEFGSELNFLAQYKVNERVSLLAKYANYSADSFASDTSKLWLMATVNF